MDHVAQYFGTPYLIFNLSKLQSVSVVVADITVPVRLHSFSPLASLMHTSTCRRSRTSSLKVHMHHHTELPINKSITGSTDAKHNMKSHLANTPANGSQLAAQKRRIDILDLSG